MAVTMIYRKKYETLYILRGHILRKGCASGNAFIRKEKFRAQISREVKTVKALKETVKSVYGPSLDYGNEQSFSFTDTWTKENKTVNGLQKETSRSLICAGLSATH